MGSSGSFRTPELLVGRYVVGERIAVGGMGEVRAGFDERLGRDVAVKFLHPHVAVNAHARRLFEVEARAAARLVHPNVVTVYDSGEDDGVPFLVMERLPGRTLRDELAAGPLSVTRARTVALDVLAALDAAHEARVLHRDIKPSNVLLTEDGRVKVTDFGIAQLVEDSERTLTGDVLATPAYLAPERFTGARATRRSDLYSVGVVLYEAVSGTHPFPGRSSPASIHDATRRGAAEPLSSVRPDVPVSFSDAVARAMDVDPAHRFGSAAEMAGALTSPAPVPVEPRTDPAVAPTVRVTTATVPIDDHATREVTAPARPHPQRRRGRSVLPIVVVVAAAIVAATVALALRGDDETSEPSSATTTPVATNPASAPTPTLTELPAPLARSIERLEELTTR